MLTNTRALRSAGPSCLALVYGLLAGGCYMGTAMSTTLMAQRGDDGWDLVESVPEVRQIAQEDCGAAALVMVLRYWGIPVTHDDMPTAFTQGIRAADLRELARQQGLKAFVIQGQLSDIDYELQRRRPIVVGLMKRYLRSTYPHYEVVVGINRSKQRILTLDPAYGPRVNSLKGFGAEWAAANQVALVVYP